MLHQKFDSVDVFKDIERYKVTKFLGVPTVYRALLKTPFDQRSDIASLQVCAIGGEKVTHELLNECFNANLPVRQVMGQTETSILLWCSEEESLARPQTVGRPVFHAQVRVADRNGQQLPPGQIGEIVAKGAVLMKEYWRDPVATEETLRGGWLFTGDLARVDEDGYFYLVDRAKDMYISGGENVYPVEVEKVLRSHPKVEDACVVGVSHELWGEVGSAYIIARKGCEVCPEELLEFCRGRLAGYKTPHKIIFKKDFPKTPLGKVRKYKLKESSEDDP